MGIKVKVPLLVGFFAAILFFQVIALGLPTANAQTPEIPDWIRTTAEFWIDRRTSDTEFVNALQYLVTQRILHIPQDTSPTVTAPPTVTSPEIPDWIRTTAKYWIDRQILDTEFVNALQYLVTQRILHIPQSTSPTVTAPENPPQVDINVLRKQLEEATKAKEETQKVQEETQKVQDLLNQIQTKEKEKLEIYAQTNPLIKGLITGEMNFYFEPVPSYAGSGVSEYINLLKSTLSSFSISQIKNNSVESEEDADIIISWVKDYGTHTLGQSIFKSHIKIGLGKTTCNNEWQAFNGPTVQSIFMHELGHSLGIGHSSNPSNIMYPTLKNEFDFESKFSDVLPANFYLQKTFCDTGTYTYGINTEGERDGFDVYVLPPQSDPASFDPKSSKYLGQCGKPLMQSITLTCAVEAGSKLYIKNIVDHPITINIFVTKDYQVQMPEGYSIEDFQYDLDWFNSVWEMYH